MWGTQAGGTQHETPYANGCVSKEILVSDTSISLASTDGRTGIIKVPPRATLAHIQIYSATWASAVVEVEKSIFDESDTDDGDDTVHHFTSFSTARTMTTSQQSVEFLPVAGIRYLRLKTTTAEALADGDARVAITFI